MDFEKEIDIVLQSNVRGVSIFGDIECKAIVEYGIYDGDVEWRITGFRFENYRDDETTVIKQGDDQVHWAILINAVDDKYIESIISEEFSHSHDAESGFVNRSWVAA